jgi:hypothetical protein
MSRRDSPEQRFRPMTGTRGYAVQVHRPVKVDLRLPYEMWLHRHVSFSKPEIALPTIETPAR